jgi:hypothetical protein
MKAYEFNRGLEMPTDNSFKPKPMVRYSVPRPTNRVIVEDDVVVKDVEPAKTSFILDELDDDVVDELPQAVKLSAKELKEIETVSEPEPETFESPEEDEEVYLEETV